MIRLTLFFLVLSLAAVSDIRKRMIPDWMPLLIAGVSLLPPEPVYLTGLLMALSLLLLFHVVRQCIRKIRKLNCVAEKEQAYPLVPFLLVGMVISVFMFL